MSFTSYVPKPPTQEISDLDLSDRLQRIKNAALRAGFQDYEFKAHMERREIVTTQYKRKFPDNITKDISWIKRLLIPKAGMFEVDKDTGKLDTEHKVKQVIVYHMNEYVDNEDIEEGPISYHTTIGAYPSPVVRHRKVRDQNGEQLKTEVSGFKNIYYIEYSPEKVNEILEQMDNQPNSMVLGIARSEGDLNDKSFTVFNLEEFKDIEDIQGLIEATHMDNRSYLRRDYGGYNEYLEAKTKRQEQSRSRSSNKTTS